MTTYTVPLKVPQIPKGGVNCEGLTWQEWEAAARISAGKPANMTEEGWRARAWACGVDPTDIR
jgi:hypothetical protein